MKALGLFPKKQTGQTGGSAALETYWILTTDQLLAALHTTLNGLQQTDAESRITQYGPNTLKPRRESFKCSFTKNKPIVIIMIQIALRSIALLMDRNAGLEPVETTSI